MGKIKNMLFLMMLLSVLGACERVKEKEAVADLPKTSVEDTLVLTPDTLEIDTVLSETDTGAGEYADTETYADTEAEGVSSPISRSATGTGATSSAGTQTPVASSSAGNNASASPTVSASTSASGTSARKAPAKPKKYVRPTRSQLQRSLAQDARRSNQLDLPQLKNYWLRRQHYYRRASKEVKYVAGDTKIKISAEETKIETPRGKVKIEGDDIKVKYD